MWLCGFAGLIFLSCYAGDLSLSSLSLPILPSAFPPPLSPSLSVRIDDGATLGVAFPVSGVLGAKSKREAPWVI